MAIERACNLLEKYANAEIVTGIAKYDTTNKENKNIDITLENICEVLGMEISKDEVMNVFRRLGFTATENQNKISVSVPTRRLDISIKEDLIEEVGRIYGLENIEGRLPKLNMKAGNYDRTTREIRNKMISLGLNETLSYVLVNEKDATKFTSDEFEPVKLLAPMTEERSTLRYSLIPSLFKIYEYNMARGLKDISIFEIGKGFFKKGEEYGEDSKLCCLMSGKYYLGIENKKDVDFFVLKGVVEEILDYLGYANRYSFVVENNIPNEFHPGQVAQISVNNDIVGIIGRVHPLVSKEPVFVMEINLDKLLSKKVGKMKFKEISKYPTVKKDLSILVNKEISSQEIAKVIKKATGSLLTNVEVFDLYTGKNILENKKSIAYSLEFGSNDRTLTDEEINNILENIIENVEKKLGAELRS